MSETYNPTIPSIAASMLYVVLKNPALRRHLAQSAQHLAFVAPLPRRPVHPTKTDVPQSTRMPASTLASKGVGELRTGSSSRPSSSDR